MKCHMYLFYTYILAFLGLSLSMFVHRRTSAWLEEGSRHVFRVAGVIWCLTSSVFLATESRAQVSNYSHQK